MTDQTRSANEQQDQSPQTGGLDAEETRMSGPDFGSEPLAGEGNDDFEATVTRGPGVGGSSGKTGEGTAADTEKLTGGS